MTESQNNLQRNYQRKVLLAEDSRVNQLLTKKYLVNLGIDVTIVENGRDAVNKISDEKFHLVLMDLEMPIQNGIDATIEIREKQLSKAPIIALTAHNDAATRKRCKASKMNGYLIKPINQQSGSFEFQVGKRYYIELLYPTSS